MPDDCLIRQNPIEQLAIFSSKPSSGRTVSAGFSGSRLATLTLVTVCNHLSGCVRSQGDGNENPNQKVKDKGKGAEFFWRGERCISDLCPSFLDRSRKCVGFCRSRACHPCLDSYRTNVSFFRYLAIGDQHCDYDRDLPHGVSYPEHAKPRC